MRGFTTRATGLLILALGAWGGLIPFIGHYLHHYELGPDRAWTWTTGRLYLDVLPGVVAIVGGLMLIGAGPRPHARLGALLALAAGIWFVIGPQISQLWTAGGAQGAGHGSAHFQMLEMLGYHTGLGVLIAALGGYALPRFVLPAEAAVPADYGETRGGNRRRHRHEGEAVAAGAAGGAAVEHHRDRKRERRTEREAVPSQTQSAAAPTQTQAAAAPDGERQPGVTASGPEGGAMAPEDAGYGDRHVARRRRGGLLSGLFSRN